MYCCHVVVSEDAKTMLASGLQTLSLSLSLSLTQFHGVLDHGLSLNRNIPLSQILQVQHKIKGHPVKAVSRTSWISWNLLLS